MATRFARPPGGPDLIFDYRNEGGLPRQTPVWLLRDESNAMQFDASHQPALGTEAFSRTPVAYRWKNGGIGAGYSVRLPETTATSEGGAITSLAWSHGQRITGKVPGIIMASGAMTELVLPAAVSSGPLVDGIAFGALGAQHFYVTTSGRYLIKIASQVGALSTIDLGASATCADLATFGGYLWVSNGTSNVPIRRMSTAESVTNGASGTERRSLAVVYWTISPQIATGGAADTGGTGAYRLVGTNLTGTAFRHIADTEDPTVSADWSGEITIGDGNTYPALGAVANNHTVWFPTGGGLYACDETGYSPNLTEWMKLAYSPNSGEQAVFWGDFVWFAHESGLIAIRVTGERQDTATYAQIGYLKPYQAPIYGRPRALAPDVDGLWVAYYSRATDTSYLFQLLVDDQGRMRWDGPQEHWVGEIPTLIRRVSPTGTDEIPYLLIGTAESTGGAPHLYRKSLPVSGNPYTDWLAGTRHTFATDPHVILPREDFDSASPKSVDRYVLVYQNAAADRTITLSTAVDDDEYVEQGTVRASRATLPPADGTTQGTTFAWKLALNGTSTQPVILEAFSAGATPTADRTGVRTYRVLCTADAGDGEGVPVPIDPYRVWKRIESLQGRDRVRMRDQWKRTLMVKVLNAIPHQAYYDQETEAWSVVGSVTVAILHEPALVSAGYCISTGAQIGPVAEAA